MFRITSKDRSSSARAGLLKTAHGAVKTPFFMPIATKGSVKHISSIEIRKIGYEAVITNGLILSLAPGTGIIRKHGSIHKFMGFSRTIFTDSGGFQIIKEGLFVSISDRGIMFRDVFNGGKMILLTPEDCIRRQNLLGSDVAMCLDDMQHFGSSKEVYEKALERTHRWAVQCLKAHKNRKQLLFGITQGGTYPCLRKESCRHLSKLGFDGYAIGGLGLGEGSKSISRIAEISDKHLPYDMIRYMMGIGSVADIINAVSRGMDCFDSVFPTRNGRHGTVYTWKGKLNIKNSSFRTDTKPLDKDCRCIACSKYTRAYLRHLLKQDEALAFRLCSMHNLYFLARLMESIRDSITKGRFSQFRKKMKKYYGAVR